MKVRILGCGTSSGVPRIGNDWGDCDPAEPKNRRTRSSILIESDGELAPEEMTLDTAFELREAGPWGQGFPEPAFDGEFTILDRRVVGERHLKLRVSGPRSGETYDAIAFRYFDEPGGAGLTAFARVPDGRVQLAYRLDVNEYLGSRRLQLVVEHIA